MDVEIFSIYDSKADLYRFPMYFASRAQAMRSFSGFAKDKQGEVGQFPNDFSLMVNGKLSELTGLVEPYKAPINLGLASSYLEEGVK